MSSNTGRIDAIIKLLENFTVSAWIIDEEQNIVYMNSFMRELFGNLSGEKASLIYDCGSYEVVRPQEGEKGGFSEIIIAEVPYRRLNSLVDLGEDGIYTVDLFEDISEQKFVSRNMSQALAKLSSEAKTAQKIQNSILPIDDTYWNTIAFSSLYMPADDLGGDFYDLVKLSGDEYLIYIADVSGHGIEAAFLTIFMRERVRANIEAALLGTGELLKKLVHDFNALGVESSLFITMALCKYNKAGRELSISNAGHNCFPLIVRYNGRTENIPTRGLPLCSLAEGLDYDEEIVSLSPGDRLILFTDGIVEEKDYTTGRSLGAEGVRRLAEEYHAVEGGYLARKIMEESARFAIISAKDDRSIVVADFLS